MVKLFNKKIIGLCLASLLGVQTFCFAEKPSCILMKFTDDTRYTKIEAPLTLSDLVMEKLVNSGRINLKEKFAVDDQLEQKLYNEKILELTRIQNAFATNNFNIAFENDGFDNGTAQSIATASLGQTISPKIIANIANAHEVDYLIQGTIINLGTGDWWDENAIKVAKMVDTATGLLGMSSVGQSLQYLQGISIQRTGIGVQCDLRVIDGKTGKVIWYKRVTSVNDQKQYGIALITVGSSKLTPGLYDKAMDKAAQSIVDALIADIDNKMLEL